MKSHKNADNPIDIVPERRGAEYDVKYFLNHFLFAIIIEIMQCFILRNKMMHVCFLQCPFLTFFNLSALYNIVSFENIIFKSIREFLKVNESSAR